MLENIKKFLRPKYKTLNEIEVIAKNLKDNYRFLQSLQPQALIIPVLKSNAYGHGLKEIIKILNKTDCKVVAVDSFPEAKQVYNLSKKQVLILGEMPHKLYKYCLYKRTHFCIYNSQTLKHLANTPGKKKIHLFLNTGMNREGIKNLTEFIENNKTYLFSKNIEITGICSHLASAEEKDSQLNNIQEENFLQALKEAEEYNIKPKYVHLGNSAGAFTLNNKKYTAFRTGISFYGYNIFSSDHPQFNRAQNLKPALRLNSTIVSKQTISHGETVSYNENFTAKETTNIYTIPFGYYEGLDRKLSNQGQIKINEKFYTIAGNICMNLTCVDGKTDNYKIGETVNIISEKPNNNNSVKNLAKLNQTIPYEILTNLRDNIRKKKA